MKRLHRALFSSVAGLRWAAIHERAFQQELVVLAVAIPLSFWIASAAWTRAFLILSLLFVIMVETVNTAIEQLADQVTLERSPRIKAAKDLASAAVFLAIVMAGTVWICAVLDRA